jgi:hypothetical protein
VEKSSFPIFFSFHDISFLSNFTNFLQSLQYIHLRYSFCIVFLFCQIPIMLLPRHTALLLAILPSSLATACTSSNAIVVPTSSDSTDIGSDSGYSSVYSNQACQNECENEPFFSSCYNQCVLGQIGRRSLEARDTLSCTSSETCYIYGNSLLICLDANTGM